MLHSHVGALKPPAYYDLSFSVVLIWLSWDQDTDIDIVTFGALMALIKAVRTRAVPPCLLQLVELRDTLLGESHFKLLSDLLWDDHVKRKARLNQKPLQLDLRGVRLQVSMFQLSLLEGTLAVLHDNSCI